MSKLSFNRLFDEKHNSSTITILGASLKLENCEILETDNTKFDYQKAVVKK